MVYIYTEDGLKPEFLMALNAALKGRSSTQNGLQHFEKWLRPLKARALMRLLRNAQRFELIAGRNKFLTYNTG
jgi:hypothetical protein